MKTRNCPLQWEDGCEDKPCARFESQDTAPWQEEIDSGARPLPEHWPK